MAKSTSNSNPLVLSGRADSGITVQLHPLVLLTISDYITRHTLRQQQGPVVGAIIGQQSGRSYTLENAYECKTVQDGDTVLLDGDWFNERLEQYRDVHKVPALDLTAMFMMGPVEGPQEAHLPVLRQVQELTGVEGVMLCLFHAELVSELQGGKLPITLYETVRESSEGDTGKLAFRELTFEVETGDAEMIGVDFVAKGGGNATAVPKADVPVAGPSEDSGKKGKGKSKAKDKDKDKDKEDGADGEFDTSLLSPEDEELIASLTAKVNAIKMLNQRIDLIRQYLQSLPKSTLTDPESTDPPPATTNYALLRNINSMLSRIPLLAPPTASVEGIPSQSALEHLHTAGAKERQDVHLTSLLAALTRSVSEAQSLAVKYHTVQRERQNKERAPFGARGVGGGRLADEGVYANTAPAPGFAQSGFR